MNKRVARSLTGRITAVLICIAALHLSAQADLPSDHDATIVRDFVPTEAGLRAWLNASYAAQKATEHDSALQAESDQMGHEQVSGTFTEWRQIFSRHPHYFAFFNKAGLSVTEAACWSTLFPTIIQYLDRPQNVAASGALSQAQIAFVEANKDELNRQVVRFLSGARDL